MTIASTVIQTSGSTGNGVTVTFSFSFNLDPDGYGSTTAAEQVEVIRETISTGAEEILTLTTDYSVSVNADQSASPGGSITMVSAPSSSFKIWIRLNPEYTQQTSLINQGAFLAAVVMGQADQHTRQILALKDISRRTPHVGVQAGTSFNGEVTGDLTAGYTFIVNQALTGYTLGAPSSVAVSAAMTPVVQAESIEEGAAELNTVQVFNVKNSDYGATGDGSTNDTTAIQLAATACREAGGGVLYFPPGTYIIRESILIGSKTMVLGAGHGVSIIKADQSSFSGTTAGFNAYLLKNYRWHAIRCDCRTTANIALTGEQTLDGVLTSGSTVLVMNQTAPAENGVYVSAAGAWSRSTDMDTWAETVDAMCVVEGGTTHNHTAWLSDTAAGGTLGSTAITFSASERDKDITVQDIGFDFGTVNVAGGGSHAISWRFVDHPNVNNVFGTGGQNVTQMRGCRDATVSESHGLNNTNCHFGFFEATGNCKVLFCEGRSNDATLIPDQGVQFTGTDADGTNLTSSDFLVQGCSFFAPGGTTETAIVFNTVDAGSTTHRCRSHNNLINGYALGVVFMGNGVGHESVNDMFYDVTINPILIQPDNGETPDYCRVINPTLIDCDHTSGSNALIGMTGTGHLVKGVRVVNTSSAAYDYIIYFASTATNCVAEIERADDGATARVLNNGTNCRLIESPIGNEVYKDSAGAKSGFRNIAINGDFNVWQRGSTITSTSTYSNNDDAYCADRWYILSDGNDTIDVSKEGSTIPTGASNAIKLDVETANRKFGIAQIIEFADSQRLKNVPFTLSFKARKGGSNATAETLRAALVAWTSTADTVTSDIVSAWEAAGTDPTLAANLAYRSTPSNLTLTTSYQTFVITGTSASTIINAIIFIWCDDVDATVGDLIYIGDVQLELGIGATPFERRPFPAELAMCQRYFEKSFEVTVGPTRQAGNGTGEETFVATIAGANTNRSHRVRFATRKRATAPTVTTYSTVAASAEVRDQTAPGDCTATAIANNTQTGFHITCTANAGTTVGGVLGVHWSAESEL